MNFPIWESRSCQNESQHYINDKKVYTCYKHKVAKYFSCDFIQLIPPDSVELLLKVVDQCRKELLVSPITQGYLASEEECNGFDTTIKEAVDHISSSIRTVVWSRKFFKLEALLQEAKQLKDFIMNDKLFIKHSITKSWKEALGVVDGVVEKSAALATKELREQYDSLFKRTADKLKKQRNRILEEKSRLDIKLSEEKTRFNNLKEELKEQEKSYKQDMKTQKEEYEEKIEDLVTIHSQLEQTESILIEESKEKDHEIFKLNEDTKNKSEDLKKSHEQIKKFEQKEKLAFEKNNNLRERIKNLRSQFTEEKKALEESHNAQLERLINHYNFKLKESLEKSDKNLQEKLAVFNTKYAEKNGTIQILEEKASKLTEELNHKRTDHQALMTTHMHLQKEKQSIVKKHAKDTFKLQQNNAALEEESKAKDIDIMKLKKEIKELIKKLDASNKANKLIKQHLASSTRPFSNREVTDLLKDCGVYEEGWERIKFNQNTGLILDLKNDNHLEFLTKINKRIPDWKSIRIQLTSGENKVVKTFLRLYFPKKTGMLIFNENSNLSACLSFYIKELTALSQNTEEGLGIYNFEVSQHQMRTLLTSNKHKEVFGFSNCKLALSSVPDFGGALQGCALRILSLGGCGSSDRGDWECNLAHFDNLIEGLAKEEDFKDNLKGIVMWNWGMEYNEIEEILNKYQFGEVEIWGV